MKNKRHGARLTRRPCLVHTLSLVAAIAIGSVASRSFADWEDHERLTREALLSKLAHPVAGTKIDLKAKNLSGLDLHGINFQGANLSSGVFNGANLKDANLDNTNLTVAFFEHADLTKASLRNAELFSAQLAGSSLRNWRAQS